MRRTKLFRSITAFALATVMAASVIPAVPVDAKTVKVSDVNQLGDVVAAPAAPTLSLKEAVLDGQTTQSWTINYNNPPEVSYLRPSYEEYGYDDEWLNEEVTLADGSKKTVYYNRYYLTKKAVTYEANKKTETNYKQLADGNFIKRSENISSYAADKIVYDSYSFDDKGQYTSLYQYIYEKNKTSYKYYNYTDGQFVENTTSGSSYDTNNEYMFKDISTYTMDKESFNMRVLVFNAGDRTKPDGGTMQKDSAGKYIIDSPYTTRSHVDETENPGTKFEFVVDADNLTPGNKEIVAYYTRTADYDFAKEQAERADYKAFCDAYIAYKNAYEQARKTWQANGSVGEAPKYDLWNEPVSSDYITNIKPISEADYYVVSAPLAITVDSEASISTAVTSTSIKFSFGSTGGASGYEVYRKVGKKFVKIATVSSATYTDSGLLSKTTYTYKVRPYYVNTINNTTSYGKYRQVDVTTKGGPFNLKAIVTNKNKIKLTWKKVSGATGYEIYRSNTSSFDTTVSKGIYNGFSTFKKVKTLKKSKKSWTDKNVKANESYSYIVRAIMPKSKKVKGDSNLIIEQSVGASLRFGSISVNEDYVDATGNRTITWNKVYGATGYKIEERTYNTTNKMWDWTPVTTLGKNATSYKFASGIYSYFENEEAQAKGEVSYSATRVYRITPIKSATIIGSPYAVTTTYTEGMVSKVTAKKEANGIRISWTPVSGAAYYKVFRTLSTARINNKDIGGYYANENNARVTEYVGVSTPIAVDVNAWNAAVDASIAAYRAEYDKQQAAYEAAQKAYEDAGYTGKAPVRSEYITVKASDYLNKSQKLDATDGLGNPKTYYYQNYSYSRSIFTDADASAGILDYYGNDLYSGLANMNKNDETTALGADGKVNVAFDYNAYPVVDADDVTKLGEDGRPRAGITYDYYVIAYKDTAKLASDYRGYEYGYSWDDTTKTYVPNKVSYREVSATDPTSYTTKYAPISDTSIVMYYTTNAAYNMAVTGPQVKASAYGISVPYISESQYKGNDTYTLGFSDRTVSIGGVKTRTAGVKKYATAIFTSKAAAKKPTLKSVKAAKGKVTIAIKKKVAGADYYKVYRATKKKGKYYSVGVTSNAKTIKFVDKSATKGKTYYYKVVSVVKTESEGEVESAASAVKKVKAK